MKKSILILFSLFYSILQGQTVRQKISSAALRLVQDPQMKHGILGLYVEELRSGKLVFAKYPEFGLAPASCQKIFTSVAAFDLLGHDFRYTTQIGYDGSIDQGVLQGNLHVVGSGDPTLGSWRWSQTSEDSVLRELITILSAAGIRKISGGIIVDDSRFSIDPIPGGWIWEDIGNYYGAGCWGVNWRENQFDMILKSGQHAGDSTVIGSTKPKMTELDWINQIRTGEKASGDNGYIFLPPYASFGFTEGTIPLAENNFEISGSVPNAPQYFGKVLDRTLSENRIQTSHAVLTSFDKLRNKLTWPVMTALLGTHQSPSLDSLNFWFLKKSINLYGEAMLKTLAWEQDGSGSTERGVEVLRAFWKSHGIENAALNILDGSGLSPQNRVTARSLVLALQYAQSRNWFPSFYLSLPEMNGMKMKSGSIGGAKSFAGYQKSKNGKEYVFAIIVNNYDGSSADIVRKMYKVLDQLK